MGCVFVGGPEEHEEGIPVNDGILDDVWCVDRLVKGVGYERVDVRSFCFMEYYGDDSKGDSDREEEVEGAAKKRAGEGLNR